ncbi:hypothetical protein ONZ45_g12283 [Pleurotus djamor]|nr:hypothetical protein ONZ45_g12283 [Pleurotus djamor]
MIRHLPLDQSFLLASLLEGLAYGQLYYCLGYQHLHEIFVSPGFLICLFAVNIFFGLGGPKRRDRHFSVMIVISCVMFLIASIHFSINSFRIIQGFSVHVNAPGGAVQYFDDFATWDHVAKDALYGLQEVLGNAAATYRCFILWNRNWKIIAVPFILTVASTVLGICVCALFANPQDPNQVGENPTADPLIQAVLSIAVVLNVITTGLMAYRIWKTSEKTAKYKLESKLLPRVPILRIIVESAAVQLILEVFLLALFSAGVNEQYLVLEMVTPVVAITFNAITLRIRLRALSSHTGSEYQVSQVDPVQTIGSTPSRRTKIEIVTHIEREFDVKAASTSSVAIPR